MGIGVTFPISSTSIAPPVDPVNTGGHAITGPFTIAWGPFTQKFAFTIGVPANRVRQASLYIQTGRLSKALATALKGASATI